jgi:site-specific recombinase XerD
VAAWLLGYASAETRRAYVRSTGHWITYCHNYDVDPLAARRSHVDAWARSLEAAGLARRTVARQLASLSSFYRFLVSEAVVPASPVEHVRRPRIPDRGETPGLTRDELRRLLAAVGSSDRRAAALLALLATTGIRIGEALSRNVEHLGYDRGHRVLKLDRKGGRGDRTVLTAPVIRALDAYLQGRASGPLFATSTGRRMSQPQAWRLVRRLAARAGLDGAGAIRTHSLRVAFITGAREAGVPLEDVQDAAGHADPRTTRRYDRGRHSLDRHAAYRVSAWLDSE